MGAVFATAILSFLGLLLETVVNVLFPALMAESALDMGAVSWMTSGYLLVVAVIMPLSGYLQRRFTARSLFVAASLFVIAGALIAAPAPTYGVLLGGRMLQGVGTGIATPLIFMAILSQAPQGRIGQLMGLGTLSLGAAPALGPTLGGAVQTVAGWRAFFWGVIPVAVVALCVGIRCIRQVTLTSHPPLRVGQLVTLTVAMVGLLLGVERVGAALSSPSVEGSSVVFAVGALCLGAISLTVFVVLSRNADSPLVRLQVFGNPRYTWSLVAFASLQFATVGAGYLLPNLAQRGLRKSVLVAGLIGLPGAIIAAVFAPFGRDAIGPVRAPRADHHRGRHRPCGRGGTAGSWCPAGCRGSGRFPVRLHVRVRSRVANLQTLGMSGVRRSLTPDGTAMMNTSQQFAGSLGMTVLATIVAASQSRALAQASGGSKVAFGSPAYQEATVHGGILGFAVVTAVVVIALLAALRAQTSRGAERYGASDEVGRLAGADRETHTTHSEPLRDITHSA